LVGSTLNPLTISATSSILARKPFFASSKLETFPDDFTI
jgi:hypothetical protein